MLVIRQAQIDTMIKGTDEEFESFLMTHAREEFPDKTRDIDDEKLRLMVRGGIKRAESHGFTTAEDVTAFISIMFEIAPNFDEQAKIREILGETKFPPASRFENLWSPRVTDEDWAEAESKADNDAWFVQE
jgi:hypothetical protein